MNATVIDINATIAAQRRLLAAYAERRILDAAIEQAADKIAAAFSRSAR